MSHLYEGQCSCGVVKVALSLPQPINTYAPRQCDCNYCVSVNGCYVSDPAGSLALTTPVPFKEIHHGDKIAAMCHCATCDDMVSAMAVIDDVLIGNVRAGVLNDQALLQANEPISPQTLSAEEKIARWGERWMPVTVNVR